MSKPLSKAGYARKLRGWRKEYDALAQGDGWGLFDVDGSGLFEIMTDDSAGIFRSDSAALAWVVMRAGTDSRLGRIARIALRIHMRDAYALADERGEL